MSHLVNIGEAIVASLAAAITQFEEVKFHGGRFDLAELSRMAVRSPSAFVVCLGGHLTKHGGQAVKDAQFAVFVLCHGTSQVSRDAKALALAEAVSVQASRNAWAYEYAQAPRDIRTQNLFSTALDRKGGIALWVATWTQLVQIGYDPDAFDALPWLHEVYFENDLAPRDGVIEDEFAVSLNGTLMSAYGRLYVSTPAATTIAAIDTYQKAAGTTTLQTPTADVDSPVTGRLRHTGTAEKSFHALASASVEVSSDVEVYLAIAKGGVVDETTGVKQQCTAAGGPEAFSVPHVLNLDENEYVEVWVKADDTVNVTLSALSLSLIAT